MKFELLLSFCDLQLLELSEIFDEFLTFTDVFFEGIDILGELGFEFQICLALYFLYADFTQLDPILDHISQFTLRKSIETGKFKICGHPYRLLINYHISLDPKAQITLLYSFITSVYQKWFQKTKWQPFSFIFSLLSKQFCDSLFLPVASLNKLSYEPFFFGESICELIATADCLMRVHNYDDLQLVQAIINLLMKPILNFFLAFLLLTLASGVHVLRHFEHDVSKIREHFHKGDTSRVFSIFMKMLYHTTSLYKELNINHPHIAPAPEIANCSYMLHELVSMFSSPNWIELYQQIYPRLHRIQQKCTNADFIELGPDNGFDDKCALCSVLTRVIENYITYHRKDVAKFVEEEFCSMFDGLIKPTCEAFVHYAGPYIIKGLLNKENTDTICHGTGMCTKPECRILDTRKQDEFQQAIDKIFGEDQLPKARVPSPWKWLVHLFVDRFGDKHLPPFDLDNDTFSDISTFRGYHWKGADCNELDPKVYPGRKIGSSTRDHDCNGIFGTDLKGKSLQEKYCGNSTRLGVVVAGDSAGAHFSIPQKFFNVTMMHHKSFQDLLPRIADQFDLPYQSAYTGHTNTSYVSHSIYKKLRKWNMCNNNDFQNIAVNGGDSGNTWGNIKALKRDQKNDHPVIFFLELIGNDVCGSSPSGYTPLNQFKANILRLLSWLDTALPKGSHVVILGLADGDLLFDNLHGTIHPLDVTYDQVYDFLNCLKISPCAGWLNTDHDIRLRTTAWAKKLSNVYKEIIAEGHSYTNFDYVYYDFPTEDMFKKAYLENKEPREMIQRCDGFHPSGLFNSYLADWLWFKITTDHPEWIGQQNPHNEEIKKIFGLWDLE